ncbi:MAG: hypothetical protein R2697_19180 [Ilumatobacteraceae bacterium]
MSAGARAPCRHWAVERMRARDARREYVAGLLQHSDEERRP